MSFMSRFIFALVAEPWFSFYTFDAHTTTKSHVQDAASAADQHHAGKDPPHSPSPSVKAGSSYSARELVDRPTAPVELSFWRIIMAKQTVLLDSEPPSLAGARPTGVVSRRDDAGLSLDGIVGWYVEQAGTEFPSEPLTPDEERIARAAIGTRRVFRVMECFHNAQRIVLADKTKTLQYVEGYRIHRELAGHFVHHAWATIHGKVIDPTPAPTRADAEDMAGVLAHGGHPAVRGLTLGAFSEGTMYIGVTLQPRLFRGRLGDTVLDDWQNDFPLIRAFERASGKQYVQPW
jgi:hypothetical protein